MRTSIALLFCALVTLAAPRWALGQSAQGTPSEPRTIAELRERIQGDNRAHPVASVRWAEEALRQLDLHPDPPTELWFLTALVDDLIVLADYPKAESYLERGRRVVTRTRDARGHFLLEIRAAALLLHTGRPSESRQLLDSLLPGMEAFRSRNPQDQEFGRALCSAYRLQGTALQTTGHHSDAIAAYQKVQRLGEALGDRREQSIALNKMGSLYALLGRGEEAMASHQQAIQMAQSLDDPALLAAFHLNLADAHRSQNDPKAQMAALQRALDLARRAGQVRFQIACLVNLSDAYLQNKDYAAALSQAEAALKMPLVSQDPDLTAVCQVNRGIALNRLGRHREGLEALTEGLRRIKTTEDKEQIAEITGNLAEEYAFAGDYRRAYESSLAFKALSDDLKRAADQKRVAEATAAFEADKKQIQIEGLKREQRIQARLTGLWIALSVLGFSFVGILLLGRGKLRGLNASLSEANTRNLELIDQLRSALAEVRTLEGLIPICAYCKKIRDDEGYWNQMETYIQSRTEAKFTHGMCPECYERALSEFKRSHPDEA